MIAVVRTHPASPVSDGPFDDPPTGALGPKTVTVVPGDRKVWPLVRTW